MRTHVSDMTAIRTKDNDLLLIVDVQEDFTYGALENPEAILRLAGIVKFIRNFNGKKAATEDTHYMDYAATQEGINLPVPHCIKGTPGHDIVPEILAAIKEKHEEGAPIDYTIIEKETFGSLNASSSLKHGFTLTDVIADHHYDDIYILGFCTGICAISNAVIAKAADPEAASTSWSPCAPASRSRAMTPQSPPWRCSRWTSSPGTCTASTPSRRTPR